MKWYVVHVISNREYKIKDIIEAYLINAKLTHLVSEILIPTEDIIEIKDETTEQSKRRIFPGYILIHMEMVYDVWFLIKHISNVIRFISNSDGTPIPISNEEVDIIIQYIKESSFKPKPKKTFEIGELVNVIDGPFSDFNGTVEEINYNKNKLCIGVLIFGRSTPIDLKFNQVEKM